MKTISPNAAPHPVSRSIAEAAPIVRETETFAFSASWLTHPEVEAWLQRGQRCVENLFCEFARVFDCAEVPASALMRITADSTYRVWINGADAGSGPIRGSSALQYFDTREIAPLLQRGRNEITILVHSPVRENFIITTHFPAVLVEAPGLFKSDASWQVSFCPEFAREVPVYTKQIGFMEMCDLRKRHDRAYVPATVLSPSQCQFGALTPRDIPALAISDEYPQKLCPMAKLPAGDAPALTQLAKYLNHEPWTVLEPEDFDGKIAPDGNSIALVWDFGKVINGRIKLGVNAHAGTIVDVVYGETPNGENGRLRAEYPEPPGFYRFTDRYILADGYNCIGTTLFERGFKFVEVVFRNFTSPIEVLNIHAENRVYPLRQQCVFRCSDERLTRIYDQCVATMLACTTDVFTDCPWRERAFWVNDLIVEERVSLALFGASALQARALRLAFSQQRSDGSVPSVCPMPSQENCVFPVTSLALVMMLADYYRYGGDAAVVRELLPKCEMLLAHFTRLLDEDGILRVPPEVWNFIDWSFELNGYSFNGCQESMSNSLYVIATQTIVTLATQCGYQLTHAPEEYLAQSKCTASAMVKKFYSPEKGLMVDEAKSHEQKAGLSSLVAQAFALLANIGDEAVQEKLTQALSNDALLKPELYLYSVVFEAMARHGMIDKALQLIRQYWGPILDTGYPTIFEAGVHQFGKDAFCGVGSMCHGFATSPAAFLREHVLGLSPVSGGKQFAFAPALGALEWAEGELHCDDNAVVRVRLTRDEITLVLPTGYSAQLPNGALLPAGTHHLHWKNLA